MFTKALNYTALDWIIHGQSKTNRPDRLVFSGTI